MDSDSKNKLINIILEFEKEKERKELEARKLKEKQEKTKFLKRKQKMLLTLAGMTLFFGLLSLNQVQAIRALERENALLKMSLRHTEHAPASPARTVDLEIPPPLPPAYSESRGFDGWTICDGDCGADSI